MSAPKSAKGKARARAKLADTLRRRSLGEVKREVVRVAGYMRAFANHTGRDDADLLARVVDVAGYMLSREPIGEGACERLDAVREALFDVRAPPPHPGRLFVAVGADEAGIEELRDIAEQRLLLARPRPGWIRELLDEAIKARPEGDDPWDT